MLLENGTPLLIDFGAARRAVGDRTQALTVILKPGYAPIEQYAETSDLKQGAWTDIYALAGVLHDAVTGKAPMDSLSRALHDSQPKIAHTLRGQYSAAFLSAIDKALSVKPEDRFASANEFKRALGFEKNPHEEQPAVNDMDMDATVILKSNEAIPKSRQKNYVLLSGAAAILLSFGGCSVSRGGSCN
jgi:serine/threonine protein kinase